VETALYRVVQEAMTNVVRHARATRVDVLAEQRGDRVMVMIEDDGVGFEPERVQRGDHFGLLGLAERAEALGGTLTVESKPGGGTTVVVEVPSADPHPDR
jgi:signal transduction histidine kinase